MTPAIRTIILDDEPHWQLVLQRMAQAHPQIELLGVYGSPLEALPAITEQRPDLILLDVEFAEINGFAFAKSLDKPPLIIIVTTHTEFALASYEIEAVDYLVKPVELDRFMKAIEKVRKRIDFKPDLNQINEQPEAPSFFFIKDQQGYVKVMLEDVLFIKSLENYVQIFTPTGTHTTLASLQHIEQKYQGHFMRVHRSYLVNPEKIDQFNNEMIAIGSHEIPLGGQFAEQFKSDYLYRNLLKR